MAQGHGKIQSWFLTQALARIQSEVMMRAMATWIVALSQEMALPRTMNRSIHASLLASKTLNSLNKMSKRTINFGDNQKSYGCGHGLIDGSGTRVGSGDGYGSG